MSHATAEVQERITSFVERLKEHFIVFNPGSIESSHGTKEHHTEKDRKAIASHTIVRDLDWFIRINADTIVAYWPDTIFSSGMSDELRFAYEKGRKTILVTERNEEGGLPRLSPFLTYKASVFWSSDEFFTFLNLDPNEQQLYDLFQTIMAEEFRAHDTGAIKLTAEVFKNCCSRRAQYEWGGKSKEVDAEKLERIASLVYSSWEPML